MLSLYAVASLIQFGTGEFFVYLSRLKAKAPWFPPALAHLRITGQPGNQKIPKTRADERQRKSKAGDRVKQKPHKKQRTGKTDALNEMWR